MGMGINGIIIGWSVIILTGCTSTVQYVPSPNEAFPPPKDQVRVIVERADAFILSGISHQLSDNNTAIGILGNGGVLKWDRDTSNLHLFGKKHEGAYDFPIESDPFSVVGGETYRFYIDLSDLSPDAHKLKLRSGVTRPLNTQPAATIVPSQQNDTLTNDPYAEQVNRYETLNDLEGLKSYTEEHPPAAHLIKDPLIRLTFIGPKKMKIGDILKYLKEGKSETLLISLIKQQETPYKKFTIEEIDSLLQMGLPDTVIAAIIDTTTQLLRDEKLRTEQERYLLIHQNALKQQNVTSQPAQTGSDTIMNEVGKEVTKQGIKFILEQLF